MTTMAPAKLVVVTLGVVLPAMLNLRVMTFLVEDVAGVVLLAALKWIVNI